jgi:uncharacterized membrane protein YvlD (DUF360 family)
MVMRLVYHWFTILLAVGSLAHFVNGATIDNAVTAAIVAAALTVVHILIKPITEAFHVPVNLISLTVVSLIFNTLALWFLGTIISGFVVSTVPAAIFGAIILSILAWFNNKMVS